MGIAPCTCCCCCKVCNWCLPDQLFLEIINVSFPLCDGSNLPNSCGCNDLEDMLTAGTLELRSQDGDCNGSWISYPTNACTEASDCESDGYFNLGGRNNAGYLCCEDAKAQEFSIGCTCLFSDVPELCLNFTRHFLDLSGVSVVGPGVVACVKPGNEEGFEPGLHIFLSLRSDKSPLAAGQKTCCWEYQVTCPESVQTINFGAIINTLYPPNEQFVEHEPAYPCGLTNDYWETDGPVCDENGHFVSQTWHIVTAGGIEFDVVVYA